VDHRARKRFGQNFLVDEQVIDRIVAAIDPRPGELLIEIGPGHGALTGPLLESGATVHVLEIDRDLAAELQATAARQPRLTVHSGDALQVNTGDIAATRPYRLVGNLPYNISTPLLFHVLGQRHLPRDMHFMLQSEVVDRISAPPGGRDYGRLSVMCRNHCEITPLFAIEPGSFRPRPRVQSRLIRMVPRPATRSGPGLESALDQVVRAAFAKRRKTLRNGLRGLLGEHEIESLGIDPGLRPEQVDLDQFIALARVLAAGGD
jgi:16S rRNA (adenine1518-N6/adenine1519-N6)-dimethyltransferase